MSFIISIIGFLKLCGLISSPYETETWTREDQHPESGLDRSWQTTSRKVTLEEMREDDIVIAVMGATGVGKTTFISALAGKEATWLHIGYALEGQTKAISCVKLAIPETRANIVLVDTPGFDDPATPDSRILEVIATWLGKSYRKGRLLNGIIFLHRITDIRFDSGASRTLSIFRKLYGGVGYQRLMLVTSKWNSIQGNDQQLQQAERREAELMETSWSLLVKRSNPALTARFNSITPERARADALEILFKLVENMVRDRGIKLRIQEQLVDQRISLPRTDAGKTAFTTPETMEYHLRQLRSVVGLIRP